MTTLAIKTMQPTLTRPDIKAIVSQIESDIDVNDEVYKQMEYKCDNGIEIIAEVRYSGYDYRTISLIQLDVYNGEECLEELKDTLCDEVQEVIEKLNNEAEQEFEDEKEYQHDLILG